MSRILRSIAALVPVTLGSYLVQVQRQISILKSSQVTRTEASPARFESKSFAVVSPRGHDRSHDTRSIVIELPKAKSFDSEEKILAEFVEGFFGGWVFTPERTVLRVLRKRLVNFSQMAGMNAGEEIWNHQDLCRRRLPSLGSILFGTFQVIDTNVGIDHDENDNTKPASSERYIDFGFGSDHSSFAGFNRLSVSRVESGDEIDSSSISLESPSTRMRLTLSCFACNPTQDKPMTSGLLRTFHLHYAMLLFREGAANVLRP